jgi:hypothetical protein
MPVVYSSDEGTTRAVVVPPSYQWLDGSMHAETGPSDKPDPVVNCCKVCQKPGAKKYETL